MAHTSDLVLSLQQADPTPHIVNVASVPQLSPFRYPGGKTWLVPEIRRWLDEARTKPALFVEPFAGGAIASLTVAAEQRAEHVVFCELDHAVAAVWHTVLHDADALCRRIMEFDVTAANARALLAAQPSSRLDLAFQTIVRNRVQHGGIMAPGASLMKDGENGRGIRSRWYPRTLVRRIQSIQLMRERLTFVEGDGIELIRRYAARPDVAFFVDPPYTAGGKRAGRRLYLHSELDHGLLFDEVRRARGRARMTYDDADEVLALAREHGLAVRRIPMKNTHHARMMELLISNR